MHKGYWDQKYLTDQTGWDLGDASPALKSYVDQLNDKSLKILIPGSGNSYEAEYLFRNGFTNVYVLDISEHPLEHLKARVPEFPEKQLVKCDFWEHQDMYDLILEQTFFCAIHPELRKSYVTKMYELLRSGGKLAGLLFSFELTTAGPPFGGSRKEYKALFEKKFSVKTLKSCYNSVKPRMGNELFFIFEKK